MTQVEGTLLRSPLFEHFRGQLQVLVVLVGSWVFL